MSWEYTTNPLVLNLSADGSSHEGVHGPFLNSQMVLWNEQGYFADTSTMWMRRVQGMDPNSHRGEWISKGAVVLEDFFAPDSPLNQLVKGTTQREDVPFAKHCQPKCKF